ncbi:MAG: hypothetical protein E7410_04795 [Ruminococcaceae bacterium]|nr:hypothetical protein [Oscillospiraceae bacterium]
MEFLSEPNLPTKKVGYVIIDCRCDKKIIKALEDMGITVFLSCKIDSLYDSVSTHPDMSIHHAGDNVFVCEPSAYDYYAQMLTLPGIKLIKGSSKLTSTYPFDIAYNVARVANFAFHKIKYTDLLVREHSKNIQFIDVAQGYSKCNICIIAKNAFITEDASIYEKGVENGMDVLKINTGDVFLKGFEYGFFGGATGLISHDILAITGNVEKHINFMEIVNFCSKYSVKVKSLTRENIVDIGSILPVAYA